jgi:hypothetical protein
MERTMKRHAIIKFALDIVLTLKRIVSVEERMSRHASTVAVPVFYITITTDLVPTPLQTEASRRRQVALRVGTTLIQHMGKLEAENAGTNEGYEWLSIILGGTYGSMLPYCDSQSNLD